MLKETLNKFSKFRVVDSSTFDSIVRFHCKDFPYAYDFMNKFNKLSGVFGEASIHVQKGSCTVTIEYIKSFELTINSFLEHLETYA
jgi:hypothetical protein